MAYRIRATVEPRCSLSSMRRLYVLIVLILMPSSAATSLADFPLDKPTRISFSRPDRGFRRKSSSRRESGEDRGPLDEREREKYVSPASTLRTALRTSDNVAVLGTKPRAPKLIERAAHQRSCRSPNT